MWLQDFPALFFGSMYSLVLKNCDGDKIFEKYTCLTILFVFIFLFVYLLVFPLTF
jgi:hypothetical protein